MIKNIIRVVVGLLLVAAAYWLHCKAIDTEEPAYDPPYTLENPVPKGVEHHFFRQPARIAVQRPESRAMLAKAREIELAAGLVAVASVALILLGTAPLVFWLFIPDFLRRHRNDAAITMASESTSPEDGRSPGPEAVPLG